MKWRVRWHEARSERGQEAYEPQTSRFGLFWRTVSHIEENRDGGRVVCLAWCTGLQQAVQLAKCEAKHRVSAQAKRRNSKVIMSSGWV